MDDSLRSPEYKLPQSHECCHEWWPIKRLTTLPLANRCAPICHGRYRRHRHNRFYTFKRRENSIINLLYEWKQPFDVISLPVGKLPPDMCIQAVTHILHKSQNRTVLLAFFKEIGCFVNQDTDHHSCNMHTCITAIVFSENLHSLPLHVIVSILKYAPTLKKDHLRKNFSTNAHMKLHRCIARPLCTVHTLVLYHVWQWMSYSALRVCAMQNRAFNVYT